MTLTSDGEALIKAFEGYWPICKLDPVGVVTGGWGHTNLGNILPVIKLGLSLSREEWERAFLNDMEAFVTDVATIMAPLMGVLTPNELDALISFDFNTGRLARSSIPKHLMSGDVDGAMVVLNKYVYAGGRVLNGLVRRRKAEELLFRGKVKEALKLAQVPPRPVPMPKAALAPRGMAA